MSFAGNVYQLTNAYSGSREALQVDPTFSDLGLRTASSKGLAWVIMTAPNASQYNICTTYSGAYCLDILNDDAFASPSRTHPHLSLPSYATGQQWTFLAQSDGSYKLMNDFTGPGWFLDVFGGSQEAFMNNGSVDSGMSWQINQVITTSSSITTTSAPTTSATSDSSSTSTSSTTALAQTSGISNDDGLSTGAKAGIGVGAAVAGLIILGLCVGILILLRRRKGQQPESSQAHPASSNEKYGEYLDPGTSARPPTAMGHHGSELSGDSGLNEMDAGGHLKPAMELDGERTVSELPGH